MFNTSVKISKGEIYPIFNILGLIITVIFRLNMTFGKFKNVKRIFKAHNTKVYHICFQTIIFPELNIQNVNKRQRIEHE